MNAPMPSRDLAADAAAAPAYTVRPADLDADAARVVALWQGNLDVAQGAAKYDWFYRRHPAGRAEVLFVYAQADAAPVGTLGMGPRAMRIGAQTVSAGVLADFAVVAEHRTVLPALRLQTVMRDIALQRHAFAFGFPNRKAAPVIKRVGYRPVGEMTRHVRVLRTAAYLPDRLPHWLRKVLGGAADIVRAWRLDARWRWIGSWSKGVWLDTPDARFDRLWARVAAANETLIGERDQAFLAWRFGAEPGKTYRIFALATSDGEIDGYAVCERVGDVLHVRDVLASSAPAPMLPRLLAHLMHAARRDGVASVSLEFCGATQVRDALVRAGMQPRDARPVYAMCAPAFAERVAAQAWYLTCADEDA